MIIIADSGSSKTHWSIIRENNLPPETIFTSGINPYYQDSQTILKALELKFPVKALRPDIIFFYGAGCANIQVNSIVSKALQEFFGTSSIEVESDLMAAARALCQDNEGIACIIGTGSNSCYYDGKIIKEQVSPLGFILGDEGSGAVLGKRFLGDLLKNQIPKEIVEKFFDTYKFTKEDILDHIYKKPFPNRFAAQFTHFISDNIDDSFLHGLVYDEFSRFLVRNVMQYQYSSILPINYTGSIAWHFQEILRKAASSLDLTTGQIIQSPMSGLLKFHGSKQ